MYKRQVLDYTSLLAGKTPLQRERCHLAELCAGSIHTVSAAASSKNQVIDIDAPANLELVSDGQALVKLMTTLLGNAVKFTPDHGAIGVTANRVAEVDAVSIEVWDTGIGMSEDQVAHLFEPFVQGDQTLARRFEGLGLGLAYVHKLVELLGGHIAVTSELGKGSRFKVTLPVR